MGVDFTHCDASWAYSGFNRFRAKLAAEIGVTLDNMEGFARRGNANFPACIPWSKVNDAIKPLLDHSDCDGELTPDECRQIAPRLRELIASWDAEDYDKIKALELAKGMDAAAEADEPLEFC